MKIYLSKDAPSQLVSYLKNFTQEIIFVENNGTYAAVNNHPDIAMCQLRDYVFIGDIQKIGHDYPKDIIYNGACVGNYFIHNLKYTDTTLLKKVSDLSLTKIHVNQGYAKCNIVTVGNDAIITSDAGIAKACKPYLDVLTITPGHVALPGITYGFLGGCSGKVGDTIVFNGNLGKHPDFKNIINFIKSKNLKVHWFSDYELTDIGSILIEQ